MQVQPRYEGPTIIEISGPPTGQLTPATRQRRRFESLLGELSEEQWNSPSRCAGWSVRDVVAHIVGVNQFWRTSIVSGLKGEPTQYLVGFDPVSVPDLMVNQMRGTSSASLLEQLVHTNDELLNVLKDLDESQWSLVAEAPPGWLPIRLVLQHATWDCWIHERDVALPLGLPVSIEHDELAACLSYAAALSPALGIGVGIDFTGTYAVSTREPELNFLLQVTDRVTVHETAAPEEIVAFCGDAVNVIEVLSMREPLPSSAPKQWRHLLSGLATAFDSQLA